MSLHSRLKSPAGALVVATALTLAVGCQVVSPARLAVLQTSPVQVPANAGLVSVDLAAVTRAWNSGRRVQQFAQPEFDSPAFHVERVRLRVQGPGLPSDLAAEAAYHDTPNSGFGSPTPKPSPTAIAGLSLAVPAGLNRLFTLEGLNCNGKVIQRVRSLSGVSAGQSLNLKMNFMTDAAGRTLEGLLAGPGVGDGNVDPTGLAASLKTSDITAALKAHITRITGYNETNNTYSGAVGPEAFRSAELAKDLFATGRAQLAPEATLSSKYNQPGGATVHVTVTDGMGGVESANVTLADARGERLFATYADGSAMFTAVTPGVWTVVAEKGSQSAWGTVAVPDIASAYITLTLAANSDEPCTAPQPSGSPGQAGAEGLIYTDAAVTGWQIGGGTSVVTALDLSAPGPGGLGFVIRALMPNPGHLSFVETRANPLDKDVFSHLRFKAKSGTPGRQFFIKATADGELAPTPVVITPPDSVYQDYDVPLTSFGLNPLPAGNWQFDVSPDPAGSGSAELFLDDVELAPPNIMAP